MADIGIATKQESSQFPIIFEKLNIAIVTNTRTIISKNDYMLCKRSSYHLAYYLKTEPLLLLYCIIIMVLYKILGYITLSKLLPNHTVKYFSITIFWQPDYVIKVYMNPMVLNIYEIHSQLKKKKMNIKRLT